MDKLLSKYEVFLLILCCFFIDSVNAKEDISLPSIVNQQWPSLVMIDKTKLKKFTFHIYDASLWMNEGKKVININSSVHALSIIYARDISLQQLLSNTEKEWEKLGYAGKYPLENWLNKLKNIWPNILKGDRLIVVVNPGKETTFFNHRKNLGVIENPDFGNAFLAIWLDENSRFQKNRKELLGES